MLKVSVMDLVVKLPSERAFPGLSSYGILNLQLQVQSVPITTKVVSSNLAHGEVYSMQHYVIKFVDGLLRVPRFPPPIKLTATI
jgi:hypothetical protein